MFIRNVNVFLLSVMFISIFNLKAGQQKFVSGSSAIVVNSPYEKLNGKVVRVEGTAQEVWGISNVWFDMRILPIPAISNYLNSCPPFQGNVYFVKEDDSRIEENDFGFCVHQDWL